ncbi:MAG: hypothetical protein JXQ71_18215 [Verrucomicrobia bacterium]|nr:hypothetical protein [Verrucomicrobiota bacterium]
MQTHPFMTRRMAFALMTLGAVALLWGAWTAIRTRLEVTPINARDQEKRDATREHDPRPLAAFRSGDAPAPGRGRPWGLPPGHPAPTRPSWDPGAFSRVQLERLRNTTPEQRVEQYRRMAAMRQHIRQRPPMRPWGGPWPWRPPADPANLP